MSVYGNGASMKTKSVDDYRNEQDSKPTQHFLFVKQQLEKEKYPMQIFQ